MKIPAIKVVIPLELASSYFALGFARELARCGHSLLVVTFFQESICSRNLFMFLKAVSTLDRHLRLMIWKQ